MFGNSLNKVCKAGAWTYLGPVCGPVGRVGETERVMAAMAALVQLAESWGRLGLRKCGKIKATLAAGSVLGPGGTVGQRWPHLSLGHCTTHSHTLCHVEL